MNFPYTDLRFADIQMLRYRVPDFEALPLRRKLLVYYLAQAARVGRDILWDQNCRYNLPIRHLLEAVYEGLKAKGEGQRAKGEGQKEKGKGVGADPRVCPGDMASAFLTYLRRVWFANGIHHHYSSDKFRPGFSRQWLEQVLHDIGYPATVPGPDGPATSVSRLLDIIFDPAILPKRVNQAPGQDLLLTSAMNYYAPDITQREAEDFYAALKAKGERLRAKGEGRKAKDERQKPLSPSPLAHSPLPFALSPSPMYGLNSRLERDAEGNLCERTYKSGGLYGTHIDHILHWLRLAQEVSENDSQREVIATLIRFYETGDLPTFDLYTILWVGQQEGDVDFTNGFTEVYGDPLGLKASWEGYVNLTDREATRRTETLSRHAQWFEDHSPVDPRFRKRECRGVSAKVVNAAFLGGDLYPASAIGINLPNSDWVRQHYGSKSVTLGNLTHAYAQAALGNGFREEFYHPSHLSPLNPHLSLLLDDLHTDLHECLGHGSGQLLPGTAPDALGSYASTIEEARADLFALYYIADPKLVELGLVPDGEAYRQQYYDYMLNGLLTQLVRIEPGQQIEEAHMRNRALIARWVLAHSDGAMELVSVVDGQTRGSAPTFSSPTSYLLISDYPAVRRAVARLLAEVQRIKSEGDYEAARDLVEEYGVRVDPTLHAEVLRRYRRLGIAPYKGFINPHYTPVRDAEGRITDILIDYDESYDHQMLRYGRDTQGY